MNKNVNWSSCTVRVKYPLFLSDLNEILILFDRFFEKYSNIKFHKNPSSRSRVVPWGENDGRTDTHDEGNIRFSKFCKRA
jgi:hypothetical protein